MCRPFLRCARLLAALLLVIVGATAPGATRAADTPAPRVVATVPPIHALVARVMAGIGQPVLLIPGSASPHAYSLRPSDAQALAAAEIVVWVGPALETALAGPLATLAGGARHVTLTAASGIRLRPFRAGNGHADHDGHGHGHEEKDRDADGHEIDAHIWLDTGNARAIVTAVAAALIDRDPAHGAAYAANRAAALGEIDALTGRLRTILAPVRTRPFVVLHDGYQYFERQFGLAGAGAIAVSPDVPPGARRLAELRAKIRDRGVRCIFAEPQFARAPVRAIATDTGARIGVLDPIGAGLAPGPDLYPRLMEDLATAFRDCLSG